MHATLHFKGKASNLDLTELLSDNYDAGLSFDFDDESTDVIENVFLRMYECEEECSLEQAMKGHLEMVFGSLVTTGQQYGYSEYTIEGFSVHSLQLGGHNIREIIKCKGDKYLHILIDQVPRKNTIT